MSRIVVRRPFVSGGQQAAQEPELGSQDQADVDPCDSNVGCLAAWVDGHACAHGREPQLTPGGEVGGEVTPQRADAPGEADDSPSAETNPADAASADTAAADDMKYNDLVAELKSRGLPTDGKKHELQQRLKEATS